MTAPAPADPNILGAVPFSITNTTGRGKDTRVEVDGRRISQGLDRVDITATANGRTEVTLHPVLVDCPGPGGQHDDTVVRWSSGTAEALIALGWTPPPGRVRS